MSWIVEKIQEDDYGCEERLPDAPVTVLVTLRDGDRTRCVRAEDARLYALGIDEGSIWPEDL